MSSKGFMHGCVSVSMSMCACAHICCICVCLCFTRSVCRSLLACMLPRAEAEKQERQRELESKTTREGSEARGHRGGGRRG